MGPFIRMVTLSGFLTSSMNVYLRIEHENLRNLPENFAIDGDTCSALCRHALVLANHLLVNAAGVAQVALVEVVERVERHAAARKRESGQRSATSNTLSTNSSKA